MKMSLASSATSNHSTHESWRDFGHDEIYRLSTFADSLVGINGRELAQRGFCYDSSRCQIRCFSCGMSHDFRPEDNRRASSYRHLAQCNLVDQRERRRILDQEVSTRRGNLRRRDHVPTVPIVPTVSSFPAARQRTSHSTSFPCDHPRHPEMRNLDFRLETFGLGWPSFRTRCSPREIAEAGFFYIGPVDEVKCWYCGGGLEQWNHDDDPWYEHAKWHSTCEFLLQRKGVDYVDGVVRQTPSVTRPTTRRRGRGIETRIAVNSTSSSRGQFVPSQPPPNVNIHPQPYWESRDVEIPGGVQTIYRAPGINLTTTRTTGGRRASQTVNVVNYGTRVTAVRQDIAHVAQNNFTNLPAVRDSGATNVVNAAMEMGFTRDDIDVSVSRHLERTGELPYGISDVIEDLLSMRETTPTAEEARSAQHSPADPTPGRCERSSSTSRRVEESGMCHVCTTRPAEMVFLNCGHYITCRLCASWLRHCPSCNSVIERSVKVRT